jgi:hypothetical protein
MTVDTLRYTIIVAALCLALAIGPCLVYAPEGWDQRLRFVALLGYGIVSTGGQINNLGTPLRWTTVLLAFVTVLALVGTLGHLHRAVVAVRNARLCGGRKR